MPDEVRIGKKTYKVTKVASYAFTGRDKRRTVRSGRNVKKIEPSAFYGCDKLKTLHVKSKKLTKKTVRGSLSALPVRQAGDRQAYHCGDGGMAAHFFAFMGVITRETFSCIRNPVCVTLASGEDAILAHLSFMKLQVTP